MHPLAWAKMEREAAKHLRPHLKEYATLVRRAHALLEHTAAAIGPPGLHLRLDRSARVQVRILVRMSADLRVLARAAQTGYSVQALGLLAGIYEFSAASAYVGTDNTRAAEWENHDSLTDSYPPRTKRREAVKELLLSVSAGDNVAAGQVSKMVALSEELYTVACMAKHGNPKIMRGHGVRQSGAEMRISHGPFVSDRSIQQARFAMCHGARLLIGSVFLFAKARVTDQAVSRALARRFRPALELTTAIMDRPAGHGVGAA